MLRLGHGLWYTSAGLLLVLALLLLLARLWLPGLADKKAEVEQFLSERSAHTVRIDSLRPYWEGAHVALELQGLKVYPPGSDNLLLQLPETRISFAWLPLLSGKIETDTVTLVRPDLSLQRLSDGRFKLKGFDASAPTEGAETGEFIRWLFGQNELIVEDGTFHWIDYLGDEPALDIKHVNVRLRNSGERHRLGIGAEFPRRICGECSFIVDIHGNPLADGAWDGKIYLRAHNLDVNALPLIAREQLPLSLQGLFDVQLWSEWQLGRPRAVNGKIQVSELGFPNPFLPNAETGNATRFIRIKEVGADLDWEQTREQWRLALSNLFLQSNKKSWLLGKFLFESKPNQSTVRLEHLDLDELTWLSAGLEQQQALANSVNVLRTLDPKGMLNNVQLRIQGPLSSPEDYAFEAEAVNIQVSSYRHFPAFSGANGRIFSTKTNGEFAFNSTGGSLFSQDLFRAPLALTRASGYLNWERQDDGWYLSGRELKLQGKDGRAEGSFGLQLPPGADLVPSLTLHATAQNINIADFYPLLAEKILPWLRSTVRSGTLSRGEVSYKGPIRATKNARGNLALTAQVSDGAVRYLADWPLLEKVEAQVLLGGDELVVTGKGNIRRLEANQVVVRVSNLYDVKPVIHVSGSVVGPTNETLAVLRETQQWPRLLPPGLQATGSGSLGLDIAVPIRDPQALQLAGEYHFFNTGIQLPWQKLSLEHIHGDLAFSESGASRGRLQAQFLGGATEVEIIPQKSQPQAATVQMTGNITGMGLERAFAPMAGTFTGSAPWSATLQVNNKQNDLRLEADLQNLESKLPPPLSKTAGKPMKLTLKSQTPGPESQVLDLAVGDRLSAKLGFEKQTEKWDLSRAQVNIGSGKPELSDKLERHLHVGLPYLNADPWLNYFKSRPAAATKQAFLPDIFFTRISADVGALDVLHRKVGRLSLDLTKGPAAWSGTLKGNALAGQIYLPQTEPLIQLNLDYLNLPEKLPGETPGALSDPRVLPTLSVRSQSFQAGNWQLGKLSFWAAPTAAGWEIRHLVLSRPEMNLFLKGDWIIDRGRQVTNLEAEFKSTDTGATLAAFGIPDQVAGGITELKAAFDWEGAPAAFNFASLNARIDLSSHDGRFLNVKQGPGKLLGIFDIRSITRYLTFDFSNIFGKGFAYDQVRGNIVIERGNAHIPGITVEGPSADIHINGRAGIVAEDFDLEVSVSPRLSNSLTTGGLWLGGPVGAAGVWLIQKMLKKEIAKGTRLVYSVKGPWQAPTIQKTVRQPGQ